MSTVATNAATLSSPPTSPLSLLLEQSPSTNSPAAASAGVANSVDLLEDEFERMAQLHRQRMGSLFLRRGKEKEKDEGGRGTVESGSASSLTSPTIRPLSPAPSLQDRNTSTATKRNTTTTSTSQRSPVPQSAADALAKARSLREEREAIIRNAMLSTSKIQASSPSSSSPPGTTQTLALPAAAAATSPAAAPAGTARSRSSSAITSPPNHHHSATSPPPSLFDAGADVPWVSSFVLSSAGGDGSPVVPQWAVLPYSPSSAAQPAEATVRWGGGGGASGGGVGTAPAAASVPLVSSPRRSSITWATSSPTVPTPNRTSTAAAPVNTTAPGIHHQHHSRQTPAAHQRSSNLLSPVSPHSSPNNNNSSEQLTPASTIAAASTAASATKVRDDDDDPRHAIELQAALADRDHTNQLHAELQAARRAEDERVQRLATAFHAKADALRRAADHEKELHAATRATLETEQERVRDLSESCEGLRQRIADLTADSIEAIAARSEAEVEAAKAQLIERQDATEAAIAAAAKELREHLLSVQAQSFESMGRKSERLHWRLEALTVAAGQTQKGDMDTARRSLRLAAALEAQACAATAAVEEAAERAHMQNAQRFLIYLNEVRRDYFQQQRHSDERRGMINSSEGDEAEAARLRGHHHRTDTAHTPPDREHFIDEDHAARTASWNDRIDDVANDGEFKEVERYDEDRDNNLYHMQPQSQEREALDTEARGGAPSSRSLSPRTSYWYWRRSSSSPAAAAGQQHHPRAKVPPIPLEKLQHPVLNMMHSANNGDHPPIVRAEEATPPSASLPTTAMGRPYEDQSGLRLRGNSSAAHHPRQQPVDDRGGMNITPRSTPLRRAGTSEHPYHQHPSDSSRVVPLRQAAVSGGSHATVTGTWHEKSVSRHELPTPQPPPIGDAYFNRDGGGAITPQRTAAAAQRRHHSSSLTTVQRLREKEQELMDREAEEEEAFFREAVFAANAAVPEVFSGLRLVDHLALRQVMLERAELKAAVESIIGGAKMRRNGDVDATLGTDADNLNQKEPIGGGLFGVHCTLLVNDEVLPRMSLPRLPRQVSSRNISAVPAPSAVAAGPVALASRRARHWAASLLHLPATWQLALVLLCDRTVVRVGRRWSCYDDSESETAAAAAATPLVSDNEDGGENCGEAPTSIYSQGRNRRGIAKNHSKSSRWAPPNKPISSRSDGSYRAAIADWVDVVVALPLALWLGPCCSSVVLLWSFSILFDTLTAVAFLFFYCCSSPFLSNEKTRSADQPQSLESKTASLSDWTMVLLPATAASNTRTGSTSNTSNNTKRNARYNANAVLYCEFLSPIAGGPVILASASSSSAPSMPSLTGDHDDENGKDSSRRYAAKRGGVPTRWVRRGLSWYAAWRHSTLMTSALPCVSPTAGDYEDDDVASSSSTAGVVVALLRPVPVFMWMECVFQSISHFLLPRRTRVATPPRSHTLAYNTLSAVAWVLGILGTVLALLGVGLITWGLFWF